MIRIALLVFDEVDLLDVGGPYEVFLTANRLRERDGGTAPFEVLTVGVADGVVPAYGGLGLRPARTVADVGAIDVLVVPGAVAIDAVASREPLREAVRDLAARASLVASVCTGAFLLGDAGLLDGIGWTTHHEDVEALGERLGSGRGVVARWVDAGRVVTGGGLSSGIAMSLHLVARLADLGLAERTARQIEYAWDPAAGPERRPAPREA